MNIFEHIKSILEQNNKFCKDGTLFKNVVVEAALKLDSDLLSILVNDEVSKKTFFEEVEKIVIFDKIKFQKFVSNKQFLPDSFTAYKNKIGLTANNEYLTEAKEVVLSWAYKDCILEGGQTKESQNRKEIFWNETLAPDEIDRLFEPKVLTNWKRYDKKGLNEVTDISINDNLIIKGNNLIALHTLKKVYKGKIKLIYIDPPYNTGNDSFQYNDNFNHSTWLTFMKNRLEVSKLLLKEDGVFVVSCDDNEQAYLKILCDEIFGLENFQSSISVIVKPEGRNYGNIAKTHEYILVYSKSQLFEANEIEVHDKNFKYEDNLGGFNLKDLRNGNSAFHIGNRPNLFYPIYIDKSQIDKYGFFKVVPIENENTIEIIPNMTKGIQTVWRWGNAKVKNESTELVGKKMQDGSFSINQKYRKTTVKVKSLWNDKEFYTLKGNQELELLLGNKVFSNPKPEALLSTIIEFCTDENDIVLDYHLGSGTTAAVALKLKRKFIGIEQMDYIESVTVPRLQKVISGDSTFVSKKINWKGGGSFLYTELLDVNSVLGTINSINDKISLSQFLIKYSNLFDYRLNIERLDFSEKTIDEAKKLLVNFIDSNQIYVPYSEINNSDYIIENREQLINLNTKFYDNH